MDRCPLEPEVRDGFLDEDGCPDRVPKRICTEPGSEHVSFPRKRQTKLEPRSASTLHRVAVFLRENPQYRIQVRGHASSDESPSEEVLQALSLRRARAVQEYLTRTLKISMARLELQALGATEPFPCGSGDVDKRDRRVDFMVLPSPPRAYEGPLEARLVQPRLLATLRPSRAAEQE
ncbi:OmpA family protein [Nannocystis punicea]|uniref:OmpA family protein n=1 Tax=Nannocystis punicea TaxID=2995304 RepID=UPI003530E220